LLGWAYLLVPKAREDHQFSNCWADGMWKLKK
jgi:hypothetical protein